MPRTRWASSPDPSELVWPGRTWVFVPNQSVAWGLTVTDVPSVNARVTSKLAKNPVSTLDTWYRIPSIVLGPKTAPKAERSEAWGVVWSSLLIQLGRRPLPLVVPCGQLVLQLRMPPAAMVRLPMWIMSDWWSAP